MKTTTVLLIGNAVLGFAQTHTIALTSANLPAKTVLRAFKRACEDINVVPADVKSEYTLEVLETREHTSMLGHGIAVNLVGNGTATNINADSVAEAVAGMCQVYGWNIGGSVPVEVVDIANLTQSQDLRNAPSAYGPVGSILN